MYIAEGSLRQCSQSRYEGTKSIVAIGVIEVHPAAMKFPVAMRLPVPVRLPVAVSFSSSLQSSNGADFHRGFQGRADTCYAPLMDEKPLLLPPPLIAIASCDRIDILNLSAGPLF